MHQHGQGGSSSEGPMVLILERKIWKWIPQMLDQLLEITKALDDEQTCLAGLEEEEENKNWYSKANQKQNQRSDSRECNFPSLSMNEELRVFFGFLLHWFFRHFLLLLRHNSIKSPLILCQFVYPLGVFPFLPRNRKTSRRFYRGCWI